MFSSTIAWIAVTSSGSIAFMTFTVPVFGSWLAAPLVWPPPPVGPPVVSPPLLLLHAPARTRSTTGIAMYRSLRMPLPPISDPLR